MSTSYGQFCPLAKACEIVTERWSPLILREMVFGSQRFSDIHRGVPLMSRSLLSKRLQELERAGVIQKVADRYELTTAGRDLGPILVQLGIWGKQWTKSHLTERDMDVGLLMWDMRRRIDHGKLPEGRTVVQFVYQDAPTGRRAWWFLLTPSDVDLCVIDPGIDADLVVTTSIETMTDIWMGDRSMGEAIGAGDLRIEGPAELRRRLPTWLLLSNLAEVERR